MFPQSCNRIALEPSMAGRVAAAKPVAAVLWRIGLPLVLLLAGCGERKQPRQVRYPALNEKSTLAIVPSLAEAWAEQERQRAAQSTSVAAETGIEDWSDVTSQIEDLRRYSANAAPDDPFALSEEDIQKLEACGSPGLL